MKGNVIVVWIKKAFLKETLEYVELVLKIFAFLFAGIWAYYNFVYQNKILPTLEPRTLNIKSTFQKIATRDSLDFYQLNITVENLSKVKVKVNGSCVNVEAYKIKDITTGWGTGDEITNSFSTSRYYQYDDSNTKVVFWGKILTDSSEILPSGELSDQVIVAVIKNRFDMIDVTLNAISSREDAPILLKWYTNEKGFLYNIPYTTESHLFGKDTIMRIDDGAHQDFLDNNRVYFTTKVDQYYCGADSVKAMQPPQLHANK